MSILTVDTCGRSSAPGRRRGRIRGALTAQAASAPSRDDAVLIADDTEVDAATGSPGARAVRRIGPCVQSFPAGLVERR